MAPCTSTQEDSISFAGNAAEKIPSWDSIPKDLDHKRHKVETSLTMAVVSGRVLRARVPPHRRYSFLQGADATSDKISHHMPPGKSFPLQVFDGLNVGKDLPGGMW